MIERIHPQGVKTIGPYSPGTIVDLTKGKLLFVSGQLPVNHQTGAKIDSDIRAATKVTLENVQGILRAAGTDFSHVLSVDIFLQDMNDFHAMNEVYATFFPSGEYPARKTIHSAIHYLVEIACIAIVPS